LELHVTNFAAVPSRNITRVRRNRDRDDGRLRPSNLATTRFRGEARRRRAHCGGMGDMTSILVGVDGSPAAQSALEWSAYLATRGGFELVARRVFVSPQAELPPRRMLGCTVRRESFMAAEFGAERARDLATPVTAVYAFEPLVAEWTANDAFGWRRRAQADTRAWSAPVKRAGLTLEVNTRATAASFPRKASAHSATSRPCDRWGRRGRQRGDCA
jgi:hypothetical protein